jgi:nicotinate phosphoribosyltransferase
VKIFASSGLDEDQLRRMVESGAPIDGFGIGTNLTTSADAPAFDCAYKLQEYAGIARRKRSTGKATWPGRKQVWRRFDDDGRFAGDTLGLEDDQEPTGTPLIAQVMRRGRRLAPAEGLQRIRDRVADGLVHLPARLRHVDADGGYDVAITPSLQQLADEVDRRQQGHPVSRPGRIAARL